MNRKQFTFLFLLPVMMVSSCYANGPVLFGLSSEGGAFNAGTVFSYEVNGGTYSDLHDFGNGTDGANPMGSLIQAVNGSLYGMAPAGGVDSGGIIFSYDISTATYTVVYDFGLGNDGRFPFGSLLSVGDSLLFGMTSTGGVYNAGIIFSYNIFTGAYADLHDFGSDSDGQYPYGSLIRASNGLLYGMTSTGVIQYDVATGNYSVVYNLGSHCSLIQVSNGLLYGVTTINGASNLGFIFSYNISTNGLTDLYDFKGYPTGGGQDFGSLFQASDGLLYGITPGGCNVPSNYLYNYNIAGGLSILHDFGLSNDGSQAYGAVMQASGGGLLYGTTAYGGANGNGAIFSYDIANATEAVPYSFNDTGGAMPYGNLIEVDMPTGITQPSAASAAIQVYPNPSTGQFFINLPAGHTAQAGNQNEFPLVVYNVAGEKVYQSFLYAGANTIDFSNQAAGLYLISVQTDEAIKTGKVLIAR